MTPTRSPCSSTARRSRPTTREGNPIEGTSFLMVFNAHRDQIDFTIAAPLGDRWVTVLDTTADAPAAVHAPVEALSVEGRSMRVLRRRSRPLEWSVAGSWNVMPRSIWNGTVMLGRIPVPVKVYSATEDHTSISTRSTPTTANRSSSVASAPRRTARSPTSRSSRAMSARDGDVRHAQPGRDRRCRRRRRPRDRA